ncbi:MAG: ferredoxin reductase [Acidimicrobiia bacterium]
MTDGLLPATPPAARGPGPWQFATVVAIRAETPTAKSFRLALSRPVPHRAGQHYVVRLTAADGYRASRSYSVASAPDGGAEIELTIERLDDGEVSTYLHDVVVPGDELEVRGPIGGWFVWDATTPAVLVAGGSGIVPLMSMLRLGRQLGRADLVRMVASARGPGELYYADELPGPETTVVYTRSVPAGWSRLPGRLRADDLAGAVAPGMTAYVCGSSGFVDHAAGLLAGLGLTVDHVRVERFGATA